MYQYPGVRQPQALSAGTSAYRKTVPFVVALSVLFLVGCAAITGYDPTSYKTATDLKAESLTLIEKATDPPTAHREEIDQLRVNLRKAYEYEKGKEGPNHLTVQQWKILNDPQGNLLGGFLRRWEQSVNGQSQVFIEQVKGNIEKAFDQIIKLESHKVKS